MILPKGMKYQSVPEKKAGAAISDKNTSAAESPVSEKVKPDRPATNSESKSSAAESISDKGGIDLRSLPVSSPLPYVSPLSHEPGVLGTVSLPLTSAELQQLNRQWQQIQMMVEHQRLPSCGRIKELAELCQRSPDYQRQRQDLLALIANMLRIEEEEVVATEPELKNLLVKIESGGQV